MPPVADLLRFVAIVLDATAAAAILAVIRLHWRAWRAVKGRPRPLLPDLVQHWRAYPALRERLGRCAALRLVGRLHWRAAVRSPGRPGLTPFHVWAVSLAQGLLLGTVALGLVDQLGDPGVTWRVAVYIAAPILTLVSLVAVARTQRRRVVIPVVVDETVRTEVR